MDDLVDGYSQFTALADEASKGLAVDGVRDPLGRTAAAPSHIPPAAAAPQHAAAPSSLRRPTSAPSQPLFGSGGGAGAPAPIPAFASAAAKDTEAGTGDALRADPVQDPVARDALKLLFSKEGNYVQVRGGLGEGTGRGSRTVMEGWGNVDGPRWVGRDEMRYTSFFQIVLPTYMCTYILALWRFFAINFGFTLFLGVT